MSDSQPYILILEDSEVLTNVLLQWFARKFPDRLVTHAASVAQAKEIAASVQIDFVLADFHLPDGNGVDFVCEHCARNPLVQFVIMTGVPDPDRVRGEIAGLGPVGFLEKPLNMAVLERVLRQHLGPPPLGFHAELRATQPAEIIQLKCMSAATTVLEFLNVTGAIGRAHLLNGNIIHAETPTSTGLGALAQMISWSRGAARELVGSEAPPRPSITVPWSMALIEASRQADEAKAKAEAK
jgi:CheY-like chemotaxis protein